MKTLPALVLLVVAAAGGCAPSGEPAGGEGRESALPGGPEDTARQLVAELLGIDASRIEIVSVEAREFRDSSLDCPQPGMSYLQVITPGYRVLLEADGRRFDVRTSGGQGRICRRRKPGDPDTNTRGSTSAVYETLPCYRLAGLSRSALQPCVADAASACARRAGPTAPSARFSSAGNAAGRRFRAHQG